jgi:hypothetical protein
MATQTQRRNLARQWAQAVMDRDGKAQYDLLSTQLQTASYASYKAGDWVTGVSSPWVQSYEVSMNGDNAVMTYTYATSEGPAGRSQETLSFIEEDGKLRIGGFLGLSGVPVT